VIYVCSCNLSKNRLARPGCAVISVSSTVVDSGTKSGLDSTNSVSFSHYVYPTPRPKGLKAKREPCGFGKSSLRTPMRRQTLQPIEKGVMSEWVYIQGKLMRRRLQHGIDEACSWSGLLRQCASSRHRSVLCGGESRAYKCFDLL
jgi:hypothetical protein